MTRNLADELHRLAHSGPGAEAARPGAVIADSAPRLVRQVHRRRTARHAGTAVAGASLVAALAVGGSALKAHVDAAGGPSTALSKRAGAECGKPFNGTGKSDPGWSGIIGFLGIGMNEEVKGLTGLDGVAAGSEKYLRMTMEPQVDHQGTAVLVMHMSTSPVTAVISHGGVVVGITTAPTFQEVSVPNASPPPGENFFTTHYVVPIAGVMNCPGVVPIPLTADLLDVVMLADYTIPGRKGTALVVTPSAKAPHENLTDPGQGRTGRHVQVFSTDPTDPNAAKLAFDTAYYSYSTVKDVAGTNIPLYAAPDGYPEPNTAPITGPFEAHASGQRSVVITHNGAPFLVITDADMYL